MGRENGDGHRVIIDDFEAAMIKQSCNFIIALILGFSILLPTVFTLAKSGLLLIALFAAVVLLLRGRTQLAPFTLIAAIVYVLAGLMWSLYGLTQDNPGAIAVMTVMVIYPILFTTLATVYKIEDGDSLKRFLINLALFLGLFNIIYILGHLFLPQNPIQLFIDKTYEDKAVVDAAANYFKYTIPNIASCIFLLPFLITSFFHCEKFRFRTGAAIIAMLAIMLLSGRRGFMVAVFAVY